MSLSRPLPATPLDFQSLIAAHRGIILKVAATYCTHAEDRADLAQEIALQLWRAWPGYEAGRPFSTWMYRVALVQRAMQSLGAFDRALLLLHLEGCSHRESGEVLGTTEGNVATRLNRIKQQLRRVAGAESNQQGEDRGNA